MADNTTNEKSRRCSVTSREEMMPRQDVRFNPKTFKMTPKQSFYARFQISAYFDIVDLYGVEPVKYPIHQIAHRIARTDPLIRDVNKKAKHQPSTSPSNNKTQSDEALSGSSSRVSRSTCIHGSLLVLCTCLSVTTIDLPCRFVASANTLDEDLKCTTRQRAPRLLSEIFGGCP